MDPFYLLHRFSNIFAPSTYEDEMIEAIQRILGEEYIFYQTFHKNLLVIPRRHTRAKRTIFLQAHLDELGFRPFRYYDNGFIELTPLSPIPNMAMNHKLCFAPTGTRGILLIQEEGEKRRYYVDIGARNKSEAQAMVPLHSNGAYVGCFESSAGLVTGKSFDDRAGCAAIVHILQNIPLEHESLVVGIFTAREETGNWPIPELLQCCKEHDLWPDIIINVEGCPGGPTPLDKNPFSYLGKGVVLAHTDRYYCCDSELCHYMVKLAQKHHISYQEISTRWGGGEMGKLALSFGVLGYALSIPVRYMHAPNSVMAKSDYEACIRMLNAIIEDWQGHPTVGCS